MMVGVDPGGPARPRDLWIGAQRSTRHARRRPAFQHHAWAIKHGGMVIRVTIDPQPAQGRLHVLTAQFVRPRRMQRRGAPRLS